MDDKVTPPTDVSEYKFTESEVAPVENVAAEQQSAPDTVAIEEERKSSSKFDLKNILKNIDWKRFARPVLMLFVILLVYVGFNFYSSRKNQISEQKKVMMQEGAVLVQQSGVSPMPAQSSAPTSAVFDVGVSNDQVAQVQNAVQQKIDSVVQQLVSGQERISNLNESISKTGQDISAINQKIEHLTVATQQMLLEIEKMKVPPKKKKVSKPPVAYNVRAIVPGRVWLESADGKGVTLRVGDKLEGYGEVRVIAPRQGMVIMSNGSIIQYGVNDF